MNTKKVTREESFIHKAIFLSASLQSHDFFCLRAEINRAIKENHRLLNFFSLHLQIAITSILKTFCRDLLTVNEAKVPFVFFLPSTQSMHKRFSFTWSKFRWCKFHDETKRFLVKKKKKKKLVKRTCHFLPKKCQCKNSLSWILEEAWDTSILWPTFLPY